MRYAAWASAFRFALAFKHGTRRTPKYTRLTSFCVAEEIRFFHVGLEIFLYYNVSLLRVSAALISLDLPHLAIAIQFSACWFYIAVKIKIHE